MHSIASSYIHWPVLCWCAPCHPVRVTALSGTAVKSVLTKVTSCLVMHCKNKLVVSTTEWLPWLQTNWRHSDYERFAWYLRLIAKGNSRAAAQLILQPQYTENSHSICASPTWLQVPYCNFEVHLKKGSVEKWDNNPKRSKVNEAFLLSSKLT